MKHFYDVKNNEELLDGEVTISQKIDGAALKAVFSDGKIKYYARDGKTEIDLIKRTTMDFYEEGISFLDVMAPKVLKSEGQKLEFEYFPTRVRPVVPIIRRPKNNLVLLSTEKVPGKPEDIAKKLNVEAPPIIFKGKLNKEQKDVILSGSVTIAELRVFNKNFSPLINPEVSEGIVIYCSKDKQLYKVTDKNFTQTIKDKKAEKNKDLETEYYKILSSIILAFNIDIPVSYKYSPENYLDVMFSNIEKQQSKIIGKYCDKFRKFDGGKMFEQDFLNMNMTLVPQSLKANISKYPWFKEFVRLMIVNYSKKKMRANYMFPREVLDDLNSKIAKLVENNCKSLFDMMASSDILHVILENDADQNVQAKNSCKLCGIRSSVSTNGLCPLCYRDNEELTAKEVLNLAKKEQSKDDVITKIFPNIVPRKKTKEETEDEIIQKRREEISYQIQRNMHGL